MSPGTWIDVPVRTGSGFMVAVVPQRRRRIFLIADFAGYSPVQILFIPNSLPGNSSQSGGAGEEFAATAGDSPDTPVWDHEDESG